MRWFLLPMFAALLAGCPQAGGADTQAADDEGNSPDPGTSARGCFEDSDCALASLTCCACKSFAVSQNDPKLDACSDVDCPPQQSTCSRVRAVCEQNLCEIACEPQAVGMSCADGFATDAAGCLIDACAQPKNECATDSQCTRARADCCGCARGGDDTAVSTADLAAHDKALGCTGSESCPGVNTCGAETPQCAQGECKLIAGDLPADACGRPDLPPCAAGKTCTVNASKTADLHGVGVCR